MLGSRFILRKSPRQPNHQPSPIARRICVQTNATLQATTLVSVQAVTTLRNCRIFGDKVFGNSSPQEKQMAQAELNKLDFNRQRQFASRYWQIVESMRWSLPVKKRRLITAHWNNFTTEQRVQIRNYILDYLAQRGPSLKPFVIQYLVKLLCQGTRLGWFDESSVSISSLQRTVKNFCLLRFLTAS